MGTTCVQALTKHLQSQSRATSQGGQAASGKQKPGRAARPQQQARPAEEGVFSQQRHSSANITEP